MIKAVCFDVGGTLVYSQGKTFSQRIAEIVQLPINEFRDKLIEYFYLQNGDLERSMQLFCRDMSITYASNKWTSDLLQSSSKPKIYEDVYSGLQELRDYRVCLLSNCTPFEYIQWEPLGLADFFEFEVRSYEVGICKPDRRIFQIVSERLGLESEQIVMIGDSCLNDIQGAKRAGWKAIHLIRGDALPCHDADGYATTLEGIDQIIAELE